MLLKMVTYTVASDSQLGVGRVETLVVVNESAQAALAQVASVDSVQAGK